MYSKLLPEAKNLKCDRKKSRGKMEWNHEVGRNLDYMYNVHAYKIQ